MLRLAAAGRRTTWRCPNQLLTGRQAQLQRPRTRPRPCCGLASNRHPPTNRAGRRPCAAAPAAGEAALSPTHARCVEPALRGVDLLSPTSEGRVNCSARDRPVTGTGLPAGSPPQATVDVVASAGNHTAQGALTFTGISSGQGWIDPVPTWLGGACSRRLQQEELQGGLVCGRERVGSPDWLGFARACGHEVTVVAVTSSGASARRLGRRPGRANSPLVGGRSSLARSVCRRRRTSR